MFDATITLGTVLQIIAMVASIGYFVWKLQIQLEVLSAQHRTFAQRIDTVDTKLDKLSTVVIDIARQEERMDAQDKRIQELTSRIAETLALMPAPGGYSPSRKRTGRV